VSSIALHNSENNLYGSKVSKFFEKYKYNTVKLIEIRLFNNKCSKCNPLGTFFQQKDRKEVFFKA